MRPKPIIGWLLVGGAVVVAALTALLTGSFASVYGPSTGDWADGAWFALQSGLIGIALTVGLAILAMVFGRGALVRVVAAAAIVVSLLGLAAAGGSAAQGRYEAAPKAPDCPMMGLAMDPAIQGAFDELEHPGWIDTIAGTTTGCAAVVRDLSVGEVADAYRDQLVAAGWTVEEDDERHLVATRDGYRFLVRDCEGAWIIVEAEGTEWDYCCDGEC